ncbi:hypothetical protein I4P13_16215 [Elizabethkingia meningoseptica]|uniref:hypothetical protein n=1 Tax=Elizabethkingia meningoseptica TaxID=238 RepID=UPI0018C238F2|nr:hypothetical protein [Elizabethkingia meningoseptica]MBG0515311.1 hypothetical protein [Elizabethkingia meningoseptica]
MAASKIADNVYAVGGKAAVYLSKDKIPTHTPTPINKDASDSGEWCNWGDDNLYPQRLMRKVNDSGTAQGGLEVLKSAHYGIGFRLYEGVETDTGVNFRERLLSSYPDIQTFFDTVGFDIFLSEIISDYEDFRLAFPEFLLSPNGQEIISVQRLQAANCRFAIPNKSGIIEKVFYNSDWENYNKEFTEQIFCFDSKFSIAEIKEYCKQNGITRFTIPVIDALTIEKVYPSVNWHSSFTNGWLDVALSVPELKKAMFEQQFHIKYLIHVADDYFAHKYGQQIWMGFSAEEQEKIRIDFVDAVDDHITGNKAGGRSLISPFFRDQSGKEIKGIQIEPLPEPNGNGEFLLDATAANTEILFPMGVDPCLLGAGIPGGKNLSGSGSDKREAYTILCSRLPIKQIRTLYIFIIIRIWNEWPANLVGKLPNYNLTTLDKNPNGVEVITN